MALLPGLLLLLPIPVRAQTDVAEIDLSQTYTDETLSLRYPEDWTVDSEIEDFPGIIFDIPIAGEGVALTRENLVAMITLKPGGTESALEFVQESVADFIADAEVFAAGIALDLTINDRDAAFAEVLVRLSVIGTPNDIAILTPVFEQTITTVKILEWHQIAHLSANVDVPSAAGRSPRFGYHPG